LVSTLRVGAVPFRRRHADFRADGGESASFAIGFAGMAHLPAMKNHAMTEHDPFFFGNEGHQILFHFFRDSVLGQTKAAAKAAHVRIHRDSRNVIGIAEDYVGRLATDAGKLDQLFHRIGNLAAVLLDDLAAAGNDVFRLIAEKPRGRDRLFEVSWIGAAIVRRGWIGPKQRGGNHVHARIRTLRGQDRCNQEL